MNLLTRIKMACELLAQQGGTPATLEIHPGQWAKLKKQLLPEALAERAKAEKGKPVTTIDIGWTLIVATDGRIDGAYVTTAAGTRRRA
jgi:hypothetical protein